MTSWRKHKSKDIIKQQQSFICTNQIYSKTHQRQENYSFPLRDSIIPNTENRK